MQRGEGGQDLSPIVESYLSSVLLPAAQGNMTLRNKEELKLESLPSRLQTLEELN